MSQSSAIAETTGSRLRHWAEGDSVATLPRIFESDITLCVMRRAVPAAVVDDVERLRRIDRPLSFSWRGKLDNGLRCDLETALPSDAAYDELVEDVVTLSQAVAFLFDTQDVGVRLRWLTAAMCPRFHVDRLPVRLVTTYHGPGSEWLPDRAVNRAGLGAPHPNKPTPLQDAGAVKRLATGDIALFKGSGWEGAEERALVHRSPALGPDERRLLLSIDPA
ncbi:DUF1826 domain-containing protein [Halomonas sp. V046]|uniref:DUF1826 domain-containing protein n=1 Tax=Halomonas sp. V046 TaxID=3459611 RepID=UPI004044528B